jgi:hypothetical protein
MTADLVAFLRAQLDADEQAARAAANLQVDPENGWGIDGRAVTPHIAVVHEDQARRHITRHDPARVLAEVEAKRRIIAEFERCGPTTQGCSGLRFAVEALALPFADREGYRQEWAPK